MENRDLNRHTSRELMIFSIGVVLFSHFVLATESSANFVQGPVRPPAATTLEEMTSRIEIGNAVQPEQIREVFKDNPSFDMSCTRTRTSSSISGPTFTREERIFHRYALQNPHFTMRFKLTETSGEAFDIMVAQELADFGHLHPNKQQYSNQNQSSDIKLLSCGQRDAQHNCRSLDLVRQQTIPIEYERITPEAGFSQILKVYPYSKNEMYAQLNLLFQSNELDWFGRKGPEIKYDQSFICKLVRIAPVSAATTTSR